MIERLKRLFRKRAPEPSPLSHYRLVIWGRLGRADERVMLVNLTLDEMLNLGKYTQKPIRISRLEVELQKDE